MRRCHKAETWLDLSRPIFRDRDAANAGLIPLFVAPGAPCVHTNAPRSLKSFDSRASFRFRRFHLNAAFPSVDKEWSSSEETARLVHMIKRQLHFCSCHSIETDVARGSPCGHALSARQSTARPYRADTYSALRPQHAIFPVSLRHHQEKQN